MNDTHMPRAVQLNLPEYEARLIVRALNITANHWMIKAPSSGWAEQAEKLADFIQAVLDGDPRK